MFPVVVCGAGSVGLLLVLELAAWQVPVLLVERRQRPSPLPRGRAVSTRSMEILRQLGLEPELTEIGLPRTETRGFFAGRSLTAATFGRICAGSAGDEGAVSPTATLACPQDRLEALLRGRIVDHPLIDARFGTELLAARQHPDHVELRLRTTGGPGGEAAETLVRTAWLIGADGARSRVRQWAGIGTDTLGASCSNVGILIDADLGPLVRDRSSLVYAISNAEVHANVLTVDNRRHWLVNVMLPEGARADPTPAWCERMVRAAVGRDDVRFRIVSRRQWQAGAWLARHYRRGRLVIVGDAAHVCTPQGGFGMNLGLADAHNLAWKLALWTLGRGGEDLLDTYEQERRPIGELTVVESARRLAAAREDHTTGRTRRGEITGRPSDGLVLGGVYRSAAVHAVGEVAAPDIANYRPEAAPGARAPHAWLADGRSTLDLFGPWFTLLTGPGYRDPEPPTGPVRRHRLDGGLDGTGAARLLYRIGDRGAVLVRPDGHVAWRATGDDEAAPQVP